MKQAANALGKRRQKSTNQAAMRVFFYSYSNYVCVHIFIQLWIHLELVHWNGMEFLRRKHS